ncbi:uncharacterized protein L201_001167 [Kwoniella dendrophila CBS 6074]|uniref:Ferric oxidoreductase domain-containing protein n=1 Tax=Kwoniella dendrophila CBS 6074 TaxID=1295534 RepID=A0AAX4JLK4_9TREE
MMASANCLATNKEYLQTIAYCMKAHCDTTQTTVGDIEHWWWLNVVGVKPDQPNPSMTYQESLTSLMSTPNSTLPEDTPLSTPVLVDEEAYIANNNILSNFQRAETFHGKYSIILISTCFALPVFLSFSRFLPFPHRLTNLFNAYFIDSSLHTQTINFPLFGQLNLPTRGQSLFIGWWIFINVLCSSLQYKSVQPNAWWTTRTLEIATYIANRTGALSFANLPLLTLFSGRNDLLLWLTNWSYSTFILLHKTVGVIATLEACLHSAIYLQIYLGKGLEHYKEESKAPYWIMGILATLTLSLMVFPLSLKKIRKVMYEFFVIMHIALAILTLVGCWYHIIWRYDHQWGYELWIYIALAVWGYDRVVRLIRMSKSGIKHALVYQIDQDYLRLDIPTSSIYSGYIYIYFLNVNWKKSLLPRPWESHPFSIASFNSSSPPINTTTSSPTYDHQEKFGGDGHENESESSTTPRLESSENGEISNKIDSL